MENTPRLDFEYHDGGRKAAGFKGKTGDCVTRAIAIATGLPYQQVYDELNALAKSHERRGKRKAKISSSRTGVYRTTYDRYLRNVHNFTWKPTMGIGTGCQVHLRRDELPGGVLIARLSKHVTAVVDGIILDTHNPDRGGDRCVYGYYYKSEGQEDIIRSLYEILSSRNE
jgi:hypothetical protein